MARFRTKTKMHPDDAREAARFKELSPHLEIGNGGLLMPTYLDDVSAELGDAAEQAEGLAAALHTIDVAADVLHKRTTLTVEQAYELSRFANDLDFEARRLIEASQKISLYTDFIRMDSARKPETLIAVTA